MPFRLKTRHALVIIGISTLLCYQNCAQAPDNGISSASSYKESLPFAYNVQPDTIAYMSCSEIKTSVEKRAYFSYRVGAYSNVTGGLGMTSAFRDATKYYSTTERAQAFAASSLNSNTRLSLSVRSRANLQSVWQQGTLGVGDELDSFLPPLDSSDVAGPLAGVQEGKLMNYFPGPGSQRLMEASLRFYEYENVSKDTRANLEGSGNPAYLVVGFSDSSDQLSTALRTPAAATEGATPVPTQAYGVGYALTFATPAMPIQMSSGERRVLAPSGGVQELDLTTGQLRTAPWDCSASYQFLIVRPEDKVAGLVTCNATVDSATAAQQPALAAIRRVLRVEDWFVDMNNHCVMPKRTGDLCYGTLQAGQKVVYNALPTGNTSCTESPTTKCPHFVSVCIRH